MRVWRPESAESRIWRGEKKLWHDLCRYL